MYKAIDQRVEVYIDVWKKEKEEVGHSEAQNLNPIVWKKLGLGYIKIKNQYGCCGKTLR